MLQNIPVFNVSTPRSLGNISYNVIHSLTRNVTTETVVFCQEDGKENQTCNAFYQSFLQQV